MTDELKLGKPQGDPVRQEFPDPVSGPDELAESERPNAARVHRAQRVAELKERFFPDPEVVVEEP